MPRSLMIAVLCLSPIFFGAARAQSPSQHPVTIDDLLQIRDVSDPQISPDAQWVAYVVHTSSLKDDKNEEQIWMVSAQGGEAIPLTAEGVSSSHPRWSPDGKFIAFLSARNDGKTQVWVLNRQGGEAQKLTSTPQDVDDFAWSPDSKRLVLVLRDPTPEELEAAKESQSSGSGADDPDDPKSTRKPKTPKPWVIDRLQFKEDEIGYLDRRRTHLYVFDLKAKTATQVTSGDYDDSEPAWSPDGKQLAFTSNRSQPDPDRTYNLDIWTVSADNTDKGAHPTQITTNPGSDRSPAWSPDGKWIAHVSQLDPKLFEYATKHLAVSPSNGGAAKVLTLSLDRNVEVPRFSPDGKSILFIVDDDGTQNLAVYTLDNANGAVNFGDGKLGARPIAGRLMVNAYSVGGGGSGNIAAQIGTLDRPDEIFTLAGGHLTRVTHENDALVSSLKLATGEYVHFKSKDGTTVSGFLYKPLNYTPGQKVPTLVRPHGGPVWAWYSEFHPEAQLFASHGYAVLLPNPRGSSGYGQDFCKAIFADWGNHDFQDDMAIVDYAIQQGIADPEKLGVGGWSYGGISTDFIIGQTTRFKAAISGAGEALNTSFYGHDQYQRDYETELGLPWENHALWDKLSPFYRVKSITTPTLFMGGDIDWNVPILGGEQMYQALKRLGVSTQLVVYPGEYHGFRVPSHRKDRLIRYLAWYGHYVKGDSAPAALPQDTSTVNLAAH
ncbi:MAG TPA: S9 family peptidase [Candidatus Acidoferrales bacterium]|nr:S9 family peptidase [Candidatus Acidoferrales bacterium]